MRLLLVAAPLALSLTGCLGNAGDPLLASFDGERAREARIERDVVAPGLRVNERELKGQPVVTEETQQPTGDPLVAEVAATIEYAAEQAFLAADAGFSRDRATAQLAAIELAFAAEVVASRANEMRAFSQSGGTEDCGCGGCVEPTEPIDGGGELDPGVEDAVVLSALAAQVGNELADELDPPSTTVCGSGCGATCETVPGEIDEDIVDQAIEDVLEAGEGMADVGLELGSP